MRELKTQIDIGAPPAAVWSILTDFPSFPDWNPFVTSLQGNLKLGEQLEARIEPPGGKAMTFKPKIVEHEPGKRFVWLGHLIIPGIFSGRHGFELKPLLDGGTRFYQWEVFSGILVPRMWDTLDTRTRVGFEEMNKALRDRAEA